MRGVSRPSFAGLTERLYQVIGDQANPGTTGDELFATARLLDHEHALRRALSDPAKPAGEKAAVAEALLRGKIAPATLELVTAAVSARWASPGDLTDAIEELAVLTVVEIAQSAGQLDDLEDELFRFSRIVAAQPDLRDALSSPALPASAKRQLLGALMRGKVTPAAGRLINQAVTDPRGRHLDTCLDRYARLAAERRERLIAVVRIATALTSEQRRRLAAGLAATYGHEVHVNIVLDPEVMGGMSVQIGNDLIDATVASRLASVRRRLAG
jgi:F-type H+-transporting ATPase subunit delta